MAPHPHSYISLCTGIAGLDEGFRAVFPDARCLAYVEREAHVLQILFARIEENSLDDAPVWDDCTTFPGYLFRDRVAGVVAGWPCQPHSVAGKREGTGDDRWIWSDVYRAIRESNAAWFFGENVPGLLRDAASDLSGAELEESADDSIGGMGTVLRDLAEFGMHVEWLSIRAADPPILASHQRKRVFLLAYRAGARCDWIKGSILDRAGAGADGRGLLESERIGDALANAGRAGRRWPAQPSGVDGGGPSDHDCGTGRALADASGGQFQEPFWRQDRRSGPGPAGAGLEHAPSGGCGELREPSDAGGRLTDGRNAPVDHPARDGQHGQAREDGGSGRRGIRGGCGGVGDAAIEGFPGRERERNDSESECAPAERTGGELADSDSERRRQELGSPSGAQGGHGETRRSEPHGGDIAPGDFEGFPIAIPGPGLGAHGVLDDIRDLFARNPEQAWRRYQAEVRNTLRWTGLLVRHPWLRPAISQAEAESCFRGVADELSSLVAAGRTVALRAIGNGVYADQAAVALKELLGRFANG